MVSIKPFHGLVYNPDAVSPDLAVSPPYDVISPSDKQALEQKSPYNIVRVILPSSYPQAGELLSSWIREKALLETPASLYAYGIEYGTDGQKRTLLGVVGLLELSDLDAGLVVPHELTFPKPIEDRYQLLLETRANFSPLFMIYEGGNSFRRSLERYMSSCPVVKATDTAGRVHSLWRLSDTDAASFTSLLSGKNVIIADGHHRYKTALRHSKEGGSGWVMSLFVDFDDPGMNITTPARLVKTGIDVENLKKTVPSSFDIQELPDEPAFMKHIESKKKRTFGVLMNGRPSLILSLKPSVKPADLVKTDAPVVVKSLDVTLLHSVILPALGVNGSDGISYVKEVSAAVDSIRKGEHQAAFFAPPVLPADIKAVAAAGQVMPQKSTYFYPKPLSGLVIYKD